MESEDECCYNEFNYLIIEVKCLNIIKSHDNMVLSIAIVYRSCGSSVYGE